MTLAEIRARLETSRTFGPLTPAEIDEVLHKAQDYVQITIRVQAATANRGGRG